ncbi:MAG: hypothetical protein QOC87_1507 [Actinomycetota bacterium]|jgi:hypothetical protein|nr:hypothetical protein [Actinomycetota bacterium]
MESFIPHAGRTSFRRLLPLIVSTCLVTGMLVPLALASSSSSADQQYLWVVHLTGKNTRSHQFDNKADNPDDHVHWTDDQDYEGHAQFQFQLDSSGAVQTVGSVTGAYDAASWSIRGHNGDKGDFSCDSVPLTTTSFTPQVSGQSDGSTITLHVSFAGASESNEDTDCGAEFTARAGTTFNLDDSLQRCETHGIPVSLAAGQVNESCLKDDPRPEDQNTQRDITDNWSINVMRTLANSSPSGSSSASSSSSASAVPSPSQSSSMSSPAPNPSPSPSPSSGASTTKRAVLLVLRKHLKATGAVAMTSWGAKECVQEVPVDIERQRGSNWIHVKSLTTDSVGFFSANLLDVPATYRAVAPKTKKGDATCAAATSNTKKHKH